MTINDYKLYAMNAFPETISAIEHERFSQIHRGYALVLATEAPTNVKSVEMQAEMLQSLSETDKQWLKDCLVVLLAEDLKDKENDLAKEMGEWLDGLDSALSEEQERLEREKNEL